MGTIDKKIVNHLARLSRLSLTEDETEGFARDLDTIIGHACDLEKVETDGVPPMTFAAEMKNVMRADERMANDMAFEPSFPEMRNGRLKVPKIL